jgi:hypothetical protein
MLAVRNAAFVIEKLSTPQQFTQYHRMWCSNNFNDPTCVPLSFQRVTLQMAYWCTETVRDSCDIFYMICFNFVHELAVIHIAETIAVCSGIHTKHTTTV